MCSMVFSALWFTNFSIHLLSLDVKPCNIVSQTEQFRSLFPVKKKFSQRMSRRISHSSLILNLTAIENPIHGKLCLECGKERVSTTEVEHIACTCLI